MECNSSRYKKAAQRGSRRGKLENIVGTAYPELFTPDPANPNASPAFGAIGTNILLLERQADGSEANEAHERHTGDRGAPSPDPDLSAGIASGGLLFEC
jgi:hypothetical protein